MKIKDDQMKTELYNGLGFAEVVDVHGNDWRPVEAARTSYGSSALKGEEADTKLLRYLLENRHCYHPDMEVLTVDGWKKWKDCEKQETFLVPHPEEHELRRETLTVKEFDCDEELYCFENSRMSFKVTSEHKMWYRRKHKTEFEKIKVQDLPTWGGHYEPLLSYGRVEDITKIESPMFALIGFYLGDGFIQGKKISFRFKKQRKLEFLGEILRKLKIAANYSYRQEVHQFTFDCPKELEMAIPNLWDGNAKTKRPSLDFGLLAQNEIRSLFLGLVNSDGSIKSDRNQIEFSSSNFEIAKLFETSATYCGFDAHFCKSFDGMWSVKAYWDKRTSLESRSQYYYREEYKGKVYCATSSTGLLMVRGASDKFGFVCGNTSPFEQCSMTWVIKMPIFVMRQFVRHRTFRLNEMSARYTEMPDEFYVPEPDQWRNQNKTGNKQGSSGVAADGEFWTAKCEEACRDLYRLYSSMIEHGVAKEQARIILPVNLMTQIMVNIDLHNLMHYLILRTDNHAQQEIQDLAIAMEEHFNIYFPVVGSIFRASKKA